MGELATSEPEISWNKASPLRTFDGKTCRIKWRRRKPNSIKPWRNTPRPIKTSSARCDGQFKGRAPSIPIDAWRRRPKGSFLRIHSEPEHRFRKLGVTVHECL